jgi:hypothetical protein
VGRKLKFPLQTVPLAHDITVHDLFTDMAGFVYACRNGSEAGNVWHFPDPDSTPFRHPGIIDEFRHLSTACGVE